MLNTPLVEKLIALALEEDLNLGDVTTELTVSDSQHSLARIIAKQPLVVCGTELIELIIRIAGASIRVLNCSADGSEVSEQAELCNLEGKTRELLHLERTILNFLQRLAGIASHVRQLQAVEPRLTILDTRKTTPGWRLLEKYAVRVGGARNHRFCLGDMILVKNNHISGNSGDLELTLKRVFTDKPLYMPVEVEVRTLKELETALKFGVAVVMFDNMSDADIVAGLGLVSNSPGQVQVEVSGQVSKERLSNLYSLGVRTVSMGALTTRAHWVDIAMRLESN